MLVVGFTPFILDHELPLDVLCRMALFLFCIVPSQSTGGTLFPDEIFAMCRELPFSFESMDINVMR